MIATRNQIESELRENGFEPLPIGLKANVDGDLWVGKLNNEMIKTSVNQLLHIKVNVGSVMRHLEVEQEWRDVEKVVAVGVFWKKVKK